MATKPGGLGRGLGELFQRTDDSPISRAMDAFGAPAASGKIGDGSWFEEIPVEKVHPNPAQPRQVFDDDALDELAGSIKEVGLLQPIVVRESGDGYELIMGERRLRAHQRAGLTSIPAIIRATDETHLLRDALLENLQRVQLNPLEEAAAYQQLIDDFECTQEQVASQVHKSRPHVTNTLRLLRLPVAIQRRVAAEVLSAGHARALLSLDDPAAQERLADRVVKEGLSVRATEELVALGETGVAPKAKTERVAKADPVADDVAHTLTDHLDTRVTVTRGRDKGRIVIEFADEDDLDRILGILVPHDATRALAE